MKDLITISSSVLPDSTRVLGFRGSDAISRPYQYEIFLLVHEIDGDPEIDLSDAIGAKAKLTVDRENDSIPPFLFTGILASIELLHQIDGRALFRAVMVPKLWLLGLSRHSRMFTKKSAPEVIEDVLKDNGLTGDDYELRLGAYEVEEHICQYRESDLDFISRWMEREGIFYFFEHTDDGEKLILCDDLSYEKDVMGLPVRYHPHSGGDNSANASFRAFTCKHATVPSVVKLKDYDYSRPNLPIAGTATVASNGSGEVNLYGERFFSPDAGERLAKLRAEELAARQVIYHGTGTRFHLRPGYVFELEDHPRGSFNTSYLTIEARYSSNQAVSLPQFRDLLGLQHDDVYLVEVFAIPAKTQFRAESKTTWPRIYGYENGTVDGAADSEYAQIDDQGRYSVKFKFDESNLKNGSASTWVRMMQPHGGGVEGFHFPLRKGTEVLCSFLGGDPDRPVIVGVVPTAVTPSPVLSSNHTQNIIQTGGENYIVLEDKGGSQFINIYCPSFTTNFYLGAPRPSGGHGLTLPSGPQVPTEGKRPQTLGPFNFDLRTAGAGQIHTGTHLNIDADGMYQLESHDLLTMYAHSDWHIDVNGAADEKYWTTFKKEVVGAVDVDYNNTLNFDVQLAATENYHNTLTKTVTQKGTYTYDNGLDVTVNAAECHQIYNAHHHLEVKGGQNIEVDGGLTSVVKGNRSDDIETDWNVKVKGNFQRVVDGQESKQIAGPEEHFKWSDSSWSVVGLKSEFFFGGKFGLNVSAEIGLTFGMKLEFNGAFNFETILGPDNKIKSMENKVAGATLKATTTTLKTIAAGMEAYGTSMMPAGFRMM